MMFHRHKMRINRIGRLSISVFLYTFAMAIIWPMYPLFIKHLCGSDAMVGIVYGVTSLFGLVFCLLSGELMQKYGRGFVLTAASVMLGACFVVLTFVNNIADLLVVESMRVIAVTSVFIALNVLVKTCSK
ncbi:MAG: MFS transporter, partial [archaeon]|nr:MFS transporter [archaeon]